MLFTCIIQLKSTQYYILYILRIIRDTSLPNALFVYFIESTKIPPTYFGMFEKNNTRRDQEMPRLNLSINLLALKMIVSGKYSHQITV